MFLLLYLIYLCISLVMIRVLYRTTKQDQLMRGIVVATLPLVGWLLPIFWPQKIIGHEEEEFEDFVTRQAEEHKVKRIGIYQQLQRKQELDIVPIEDALLVSANKTRRKVMLDVLKQDAMNYMEVLQRAVSNEDKETSYYAVSAIIEAKRKLQLSMQDLAVKFDACPEDAQVAQTYAEVLKAYMKSGFLDDRTLLKYRHIYRTVLGELMQQEEPDEWAFNERVELELLLGSFADAERIAQVFIETFPDSEAAYLSMMKVCFEIRSVQRLQEALDGLKKAPIKLSNQGLTLVRFWSRGA